jgi:hypothetical protein
MPGINTTGTPNTRDYILGRGRLLAAKLTTGGVPDADGFRNLGNVSEFSVSSEVEELEHQSTQECIKSIDKTFLISQELSLAISLEEVGNYENVALFLAGTNAVHDNPHDTTFTDAVISTAVHLGNWYPLYDDNGVRVYNLGAGGCVYDLEENSGPTALVEGTDYEIDENLGMVRFLPTAVNIAEGEQANLNITVAATVAVDLDQVDGLETSAVELALVFIQENAGDCGQTHEWYFPLVTVRGEGDLALIGDEVAVMQLTGTAQKNLADITSTSPVRLRTYDMQA